MTFPTNYMIISFKIFNQESGSNSFLFSDFKCAEYKNAFSALKFSYRIHDQPPGRECTLPIYESMLAVQRSTHTSGKFFHK